MSLTRRSHNRRKRSAQEEYEVGECYVSVLCGHAISLPSGSMYSRRQTHGRTERGQGNMGKPTVKILITPSIG